MYEAPVMTIPTITGVHLVLGIVGYMIWRYLTRPEWEAGAAAATSSRPQVARAQVCREAAVPGRRWERRAHLMHKLHDERSRRYTTRRKLQRAA